MNTKDLDNLVHLARGIPNETELDIKENWDSLDHLAVMTRLFQEIGPLVEQIPGIVDATSFEQLVTILVEAKVVS